MNLKDVDLNLLVVFDALMKTRNLTTAGRSLGLAQPTISHSLARLRLLCNDPLLVRIRNTLEPTPRAQQLAAPVAEALELVQQSLSRSVLFAPESSQASFRILMSDIGQVSLLPKLVRHLRLVAPHVQITVVQVPRDAYANAMQQGYADLAIGSLHQLQAGFMRQRLFEDTFACLVGSDNSSIGDEISLEQYIAANHVAITSPGFSENEVERLLLPAGRSRNVCVRVPHYLAAPNLLPGTDLVATLPTRVIGALEHPARVRRVALWRDVPMMGAYQYWHSRVHDDHAHRWLRGIVAELFTEPSSRALRHTANATGAAGLVDQIERRSAASPPISSR